jgi:hypothetical protein
MTTLPLSPQLLDTFRSLSVKKRQGVLEIISPDREYELTFFEGKIIHADRVDQSFIQFIASKVKSVSNLLSTELESVGRGEQITRLLQLTELELPKLIELKKSYDRETLSFLAEEHSFSFDFRTKIVRCPEGLSLDLSPGHYLLDLLEAMAIPEEVAKADVEHSSKLLVSAEGTVHLDSPALMVSPAVQNIAKAKVAKTATRKVRKHRRRPPRAGRFKELSEPKKHALKSILKLSGEQALMGVKLMLILILSLVAPKFLSDWCQILYSFLVL